MDKLALGAITLNPTNTGCVAVAGATTISTTVASNHIIGGKFGTALAITTGGARPTTDANTGAAFPAILPNTAAALVIGINAAGAYVLAQGPATPTEVGVTNTVGAFIKAPDFPPIPDDFCPIAYTLIRAAPSLTAGFLVTTNWNATGASCTTFKNVATLPDKPQIA
jgi:hypothetical protein